MYIVRSIDCISYERVAANLLETRQELYSSRIIVPTFIEPARNLCTICADEYNWDSYQAAFTIFGSLIKIAFAKWFLLSFNSYYKPCLKCCIYYAWTSIMWYGEWSYIISTLMRVTVVGNGGKRCMILLWCFARMICHFAVIMNI